MKNTITFQEFRAEIELAVLEALDDKIEQYASYHSGWTDFDLPKLIPAVRQHAERLWDRVMSVQSEDKQD